MGKTLRIARFEPTNVQWDHEHCVFCWEKITSCACGGSVAYVTQDGKWWICEDCYNDFKDMFLMECGRWISVRN